MRVIAGSAKGTRLAPVPSGTRPMSDRAREGLFSSLGSLVEDAAVLDLFAGTGATGIEALSRGAARALFVDSAPAAVKTIRENLRRTRLESKGEVRRQDATKLPASRPGSFDLLLVDPPYRMEQAKLDFLLSEIAGQGLATSGGRVVLTRSSRSYIPVIPIDWRAERRLAYGDAVVLVYET